MIAPPEAIQKRPTTSAHVLSDDDFRVRYRPRTGVTMFDAIQARCVAKEWDEALDLALVAWGQTRAPAYANLIDAISAKTSRAAIPTGSGSYWYESVQQRWIYRARSLFAVDIPVLLDAFSVDLATHETRHAFDATRAGARVREALAKESLTLEPDAQGPFMAIAIRLEILAGFRPDPRIAKGLVRFLKLAPVAADGWEAVATYAPVYDFIAWLGDVRVRPSLEALPASNARDRVLEALRTKVIAALPEEENVRTLARDLGFTESATPLDVKELLEMVVSDLDDDTPRAILGDLWLEANDPRGEFVQLQLRAARSELSSAELERMASLEAQNLVDWLGDLSLITTARRFHRGFLDEIALAPDATVPRARWETAMRDLRLGTVRVIRRGTATDRLFREVMSSPALRNLEAIEIASAPFLEQFLESQRRPPKLRSIELATQLFGIETARAQVEPLLALGLSVSISFPYVGSIIEYVPLLALATERAGVSLQGIDVRLVAKRTQAGPALEVVSKDPKLVEAALVACRGGAVSISRPRGAKLFGPYGETRRLANLLKNNREDWRVTLDASWTEMLNK